MGGIFIAQTWLATDLAAGMNFKSADTAFYEIAEAAGGQWLSMLTAVATALAWGVTVSITSQAAVSRLLYSMARDGRLPRAGQGPSALPDAARQPVPGGGAVAGNRLGLPRRTGRAHLTGELRCPHRLLPAAPERDQPLLPPPALRPVVAASTVPAGGPGDHRLRAVQHEPRRTVARTGLDRGGAGLPGVAATRRAPGANGVGQDL